MLEPGPPRLEARPRWGKTCTCLPVFSSLTRSAIAEVEKSSTTAATRTCLMRGGILRPRARGWQAKRGDPSDRGRGVGAAGKLGRHLAQAKRRPEAPPELRAAEERDQLRELPREPVPQGAVEAAHHGPARRPEHGREVAHVADPVPP